jgi:2-C-methyl-D-erythritol 4-phosphate cytidylyltransferase
VLGAPPTVYSRAVDRELGDRGAPRVAAVVLAGGSGVRVGQGRNKAYLPISGRTAVGMSLRVMATVPGLRRLVLVVRDGDEELAARTLDEEVPRPPVPVELVRGGATRHRSEECALRHLEPAIRSSDLALVLIHDAARPLCSPGLVAELVRTAAAHGGAVPGLVADDLAGVGGDGSLVPLAGSHIRVQTPQVFAAAPLLAAYRHAAESEFDGTDTAACVERFSSLDVRYVEGEQQNFKITYPQDVYVADRFVRTASHPPVPRRTGHGREE